MNKLQFFEVAQLLYQVDQYYAWRTQWKKSYDSTDSTAYAAYYAFRENGQVTLREIVYQRLTEHQGSITEDLTRSDLLQLVEEEWVDDTLERLNAMKAAYKQHYEKTEPV